MMRQRNTQRMNTPAPVRKVRAAVPSTGHAPILDGQAKAEFKTHEQALDAARDLRRRSPMLQIKVFDAEKKSSELVAT
jgi:hypothetical protein